jgi:hypothetical protein
MTTNKEEMMVDNTNPTNQFHPYQPPDAVPHTGSPAGLSGMLRRVGIHSDQLSSLGDSLKNLNVNDSVNKARDYARRNPALLLGGLAAVVIGMGMMRGRR